MKSSSSVDEPFCENSTTSGSQDLDTFEAMSVFTGSVMFEDGDNEEGDSKIDLEDEIVAKEHKEAVARLKIVVLTVLFVSVIGMSLAIFFYASRVEYSKFEEYFASDARQVFYSVETSLLLKFSMVESFLTDVNAFSGASNDSWPFVTTPTFATRASQALLISQGAKLSQYHFVTGAERLLWEDYSVANDGWVDESFQFQSQHAPWNSTALPAFETSPVIVGIDGSQVQADWYLPLWQNFPLDARMSIYNVDGAQIPVLQASLPFLLNHTAVISGIIESKDQGRTEVGPASEIYVPIVTNAGSSTLDGVLSLTFYWKEALSGILPPGYGAMSVVIANECDETFSYKLNGEEASFTGFGGVYENQYRHLEESFPLFAADEHSPKLQVGGNCTYSISIYPTESKEKAYRTSNPAILAFAALIIFMFTAAHFTLYDYVVDFKNQEVLKSGEYALPYRFLSRLIHTLIFL